MASAIQQRHLADEAQGIPALVVIPSTLEHHHTVLVLVPTPVVVRLTAVPVTVGQLASVSPAPHSFPLAVCHPNPVWLRGFDGCTDGCFFLTVLEHNKPCSILSTTPASLPVAQLGSVEHPEGEGAGHGVAAWY